MVGLDHFFYYPNAQCYGLPEELDLTYETAWFARDGEPQLHGWFFPAQRAAGFSSRGASQGVEPLGTVLHLHGNAGNISGHFLHVAWLPAAGWNVLCFDYRGYGHSHGRIGRAGTIADAHAALDYLLRRPDVDPRRVVAFGQSLGGAIGIVLAAERGELRALAIDGAFDSYARAISWHIHHNPLLLPLAWWVPKTLVGHEYDPIDYVGRIAPRPVLIMHGTADQVVDPRTAGRLYDAAREPKELWMVEGADHYGAMLEHAPEARRRLLGFFSRALAEE